MKKQKTNKVKTVVYLIHFILIDIWARNGVLHIFFPPPPPSKKKIITSSVQIQNMCHPIFQLQTPHFFPNKKNTVPGDVSRHAWTESVLFPPSGQGGTRNDMTHDSCHQEVQVPEMEVWNLMFGYFGGGFSLNPCILLI